MRLKVIIGVMVALLALGLVVPFASAGPIDTGDVEYTIEDQRVNVEHENGVASVSAGVSTGEHTIHARGARCYFDSEVTDVAEQCTTPEADVVTSDPTVNVSVDVPLLGGERAPGARPSHEYGVFGGALAPSTHSVPELVLATALAGAGAFSAYWLWRGARFLGLAGLMPLYSYIPDEKLLDDPNRARIFALIRDEPGASTKDIAERLGLAWGTATHHLNKLEKRRMIVSRKYGKYRRYFANGAVPQQEGKEALAVLRVPQTADVATFIQRHPGLSQKEVSERLDVSASTVLWHVKRLIRVGLVEKVRDGKRVKYFPTQALAAASDVTTPPTARAAAPAAGGAADDAFFMA